MGIYGTELDNLMIGYYRAFGREFPMAQAPSIEAAKRHIDRCILSATAAEVLMPDIYGSLEGMNV